MGKVTLHGGPLDGQTVEIRDGIERVITCLSPPLQAADFASDSVDDHRAALRTTHEHAYSRVASGEYRYEGFTIVKGDPLF